MSYHAAACHLIILFFLGMYKKGEYDLAGFSVGAVKRSEILPQGIVAGDMLIGTYVLYVHTCQSLLGCNYCDKRLPCPVLSCPVLHPGDPLSARPSMMSCQV